MDANRILFVSSRIYPRSVRMGPNSYWLHKRRIGLVHYRVNRSAGGCYLGSGTYLLGWDQGQDCPHHLRYRHTSCRYRALSISCGYIFLLNGIIQIFELTKRHPITRPELWDVVCEIWLMFYFFICFAVVPISRYIELEEPRIYRNMCGRLSRVVVWYDQFTHIHNSCFVNDTWGNRIITPGVREAAINNHLGKKNIVKQNKKTWYYIRSGEHNACVFNNCEPFY